MNGTRIRKLVLSSRVWLTDFFPVFLILLFGLGFSEAATLAATTKPLSFAKAMTTILERSTDLQTSESQLRNTEYANLTTRTALLPTVSYAYTEATTKFRGVGPRSPSQSSALSANWNLFRFGADAANWRAAIQQEKRFETLVEATTLTVQSQAVSALVNFIGQSAQAEVAEKLYRLNVDSHEIAKARYKKGLLAKQEVDKVFIDVQNAMARWQDSKIAAIEAESELQRLLGHSEVEKKWPWRDLFLNASSAKQKSLVEEFRSGYDLRNIPSWRSAEYEFNRNDYLVSRTVRNFLPSLDFSGNYNFGGTSSTTAEYTAALTFSVPLFDGLARYSAYKSQVESRAESELSQEAARRSVDSEWSAAEKEFAIAVATALARAEALQVARRIYRDNELRFRGGRATANDIAIDQARLFQAEQNAVSGWSSLHIAIARICHAKGKRVEDCIPQSQL